MICNVEWEKEISLIKISMIYQYTESNTFTCRVGKCYNKKR